MKTHYSNLCKLSLSCLIALTIFLLPKHAISTHAMGLDITYLWLGGDTFEVTVAFYRDCEGINAPANATINVSSVSCAQSFTPTLPLFSSQELSTVCDSLTTTCQNGPYPGVEEYIYKGIVVLPTQCNDWVFGYQHCCRNNAINTIQNPGNENIYVQAILNNFDFTDNSSPLFGFTPVPFICQGAPYCFNNGAVDPDGDSLAYKLVTPTTGPNPADTVTYLNNYSASQPITSTPPVSLNPQTGDICMQPTLLGEISVMQVVIEEWRDNMLVGQTERDIQLKVIDCGSNNLPYVNGINGTGKFHTTVCANDQLNFFTNGLDIDNGQTVTMAWNNGIPNATFNITGSTGNFSWTPNGNDISNIPHCFSVEVTDDNCPMNGSQTFTFCITVVGLDINTNAIQTLDCAGECDGVAAVNILSGNASLYQWSNNQNTQIINNLCAGTYTITVSDNAGCSAVDSLVLVEPPPLVIGSMTSANLQCFGDNNATASVGMTGGTSPYYYLWSNSQNQQTATGLGAGTYTITITDANGCTIDTTVLITQPTQLNVVISNSYNNPCFGNSAGSATATVSGGTNPYNYQWSVNANSQTTPTATGLSAGTYSITITDANNCTAVSTITISQPTPVDVSSTNIQNALCFGSADGALGVSATGGSSPYTYQWDGNTNWQTNASATGLSAGTYYVTITDNNGCIFIDTLTINEPTQLTGTITSQTNLLCNGQGTGSGIVEASGGTPNYTYEWNNNHTSNNQNNLQAGSYTITVTDANGCTAIVAMNITEPEVLAVTASAFNETCKDDCDGIVDATVTGGTQPYNYTWQSGQSTEDLYSLCTGGYMVTVTDANNCTAITSVNIRIENPTPIADFYPNPNKTDVNQTFIRFYDQSFGEPNQWFWTYYSPDNTTVLGSGTKQNDSFTFPADTGTYPVKLQIITEAGCTHDTIKEVFIDGIYNLFTPNAFTPNGDGLNDVFFPIGIGINPDNFTMLIFDRWGEIIFETSDINKGWDGTAKGSGRIVQNGVYVWKIRTEESTAKQSKHQYFGHVTIAN